MDSKPTAKQLHKTLDLHVNDQFYVFQPQDDSLCLVINRITGEITLEPPSVLDSRFISRADKIFGIMGLLSLTTSDFVVVVTGRKSHGHIFGHEVFRATGFKVLPLAASPLHQHPVESHLLALVHSHLYEGQFWFSYTYDLTRRLQAQRLSSEKDVKKALWETTDDRFFWNKFLHSRLIDISTSITDRDLSRFILPVTFGSFDICDATINSHAFRFALISRRSRFRAGTRYFTRGIDDEGHVANFNETEQILIINEGSENGSVMSFVQTRGSVPIYWTEVNTLRYKPDLQIMDRQYTPAAFKLHIQDQILNYGSQHIVNLINQKGYEKPIKEAFERQISEITLPQVQYDYFDFHKECRNMQWHRIAILIKNIETDLLEKGYYYDKMTADGPTRLQTGVIRTNCMDNLDRTNVVQSALAKWTLTHQLKLLGILGPNEEIDSFEQFLFQFRRMWADHADSISRAYSGTGALKTDFTRTGKRTKQGAIQDGINSIMRYVKNNHFDGTRQDAFDIVTGNWIPRNGPGLTRSLLVDSRPLVIRSMPYVLYFSIFMIFAGLTLPRSSDYSLFYYFSIWFSLVGLSVGFIFFHGVDYVSWPRLNPPTEAIYYTGPGFRSGRNGLGQLTKHKGTLPAKSSRRPRANSRLEEVEMGGLKKRND